jgi:hypothetical protein
MTRTKRSSQTGLAWWEPPQLAAWQPEMCLECGHLHGGDCPAPVTALPPGLFDDAGELTDLGALVEEAANFLAARCRLDPAAEAYPYWAYAQLAALAAAGPREECGTGPLNGSTWPTTTRPAAGRVLPPRAGVDLRLRRGLQGAPQASRRRLLQDRRRRAAGRPRGHGQARLQAGAAGQGVPPLPWLWPHVRGGPPGPAEPPAGRGPGSARAHGNRRRQRSVRGSRPAPGHHCGAVRRVHPR